MTVSKSRFEQFGGGSELCLHKPKGRHVDRQIGVSECRGANDTSRIPAKSSPVSPGLFRAFDTGWEAGGVGLPRLSLIHI